ncbi:MAG: hypothetical protein QM713_04665 [Arachnia sp.]
MKNITRTAVALVLPGLLLASGCSLTTSTEPASPATGPVKTVPAEQKTPAPETTPPTPSETPSQSPSGAPTEDDAIRDWDPDGVFDRDTYLAAATIEDACTAGKVVADKDGTIVSIPADCPQVEVIGVGAVVVAEDIGALSVSGAGAVVLVKGLESVHLTEDAVGAVVIWEDGSPQIQNEAVGSVVRSR